jgi:hypothetical protein
MCPADGQSDGQNPALLPAVPSREPPSAADQRRETIAQLVQERLLNDGVVLSPQSAAEILDLAEAAVEPLVAVMVDCRLRDPNGPAAGWAPVHAAQLLGQLCDVRSVEPLLDVLATTNQLSPLRVTVERALAPMGARLIAPILARLPTAVDGYRLQLWSLLANAKVRDKRIFVQLLDALAEYPEQGAMHLAEYGDPAALPELSRALDAYQINLTDDGDHALFELREAIQELGGTLTAGQQTKYEHALLACRIKVSAEMELQRRRAVSPDSPCPCGSGRRYRHCCLQ